jgi:hypothetical protein
MTSQTQTASQIDLTRLAAAIDNTKRAALLWQHPVDQTHLDDLMDRLRDRMATAETGEQFAEVARLEAELLGGPFYGASEIG